jgi:hypothetical protein
MIHNLMVLDNDEDCESEEYSDEWDKDAHLVVGALNHMIFHNRTLHKSAGSGTARANIGNVGAMYALGTRIAKNSIDTLPYNCGLWLSPWGVVARSIF